METCPECGDAMRQPVAYVDFTGTWQGLYRFECASCHYEFIGEMDAEKRFKRLMKTHNDSYQRTGYLIVPIAYPMEQLMDASYVQYVTPTAHDLRHGHARYRVMIGVNDDNLERR